MRGWLGPRAPRLDALGPDQLGPGCHWGWLYARQTSLLGVVFALDVLGLESLLT